MDIYSLLNITFFVLTTMGMIAGVGIAVVMALAVKKIKPGVWIGMCAVGMVLMVLSAIATAVLRCVGDDYVLTLKNVLRNIAQLAAYLCAAGFMMCAAGKKKSAAVLLLIPVVLYIASINISSFVSNIKYGNGIADTLIMMIRGGVFDMIWFVSCVLLAVWYLTGRKTALGVITALLTVVSLIGGLCRGARIGIGVWLSDYEIYTIGGLLAEWDLTQWAMDAVQWKPLLYVFVIGYSVPHCIWSVQVIQACLLSGKFGKSEVKKVTRPVAAVQKAPARNAVKAEPVKAEAAEAKAAPQVKFCAYCGSRLPEGSVFCNKCGEKVG